MLSHDGRVITNFSPIIGHIWYFLLFLKYDNANEMIDEGGITPQIEETKIEIGRWNINWCYHIFWKGKGKGIDPNLITCMQNN